MILLVLLLAMETVTRSAVSSVEQVPDPSEIEAQIKEMERRRESLVAEIAAHEAAAAAAHALTPLDAVRYLQTVRGNVDAARRRIASLSEQVRTYDIEIEKLLKDLASGETRVQQLTRDMSDAEREAAKRILRPVAFIPESDTQKAAHLVECGSNTVRVVSLSAPRRSAEWSSVRARSEFGELLRSCSASEEYFVFMLKPSGVSLGMSLFLLAKSSGFEAGYDALEEDATVADGGGS
jgi:DNA repair exonuclease SbcCD ATPase subunit